MVLDVAPVTFPVPCRAARSTRTGHQAIPPKVCSQDVHSSAYVRMFGKGIIGLMTAAAGSAGSRVCGASASAPADACD